MIKLRKELQMRIDEFKLFQPVRIEEPYLVPRLFDLYDNKIHPSVWPIFTFSINVLPENHTMPYCVDVTKMIDHSQ